ncbi:hypothetical protein [Carnobacterium alterfunditum]|uniref:hypothetical protein n=1 Tax=Carnobacterium alterfunditum TaxID=28230 RepID=UPI003593CD34
MDAQTAALAAAIISAVGIFIQIIMAVYNNNQLKKLEQKKIDADIISKSRMQWIIETRKLVSDFMNDASFLLAQITLFCEKSVQVSEYCAKLENIEISKNTNKVMDDIKQLEKLIDIVDQQQLVNVAALNELQEKMSRSRLLIKLQFSDNKENNLIVEKVESIINHIRIFILKSTWSQCFSLKDKKKLLGESVALRESEQKEIEELVEILREYYKKEWEKVKLGE